MIELVIRNNDSITKTIVNVKYIRWFDLLIDSGELLIWMIGNEFPLIFTNEILVENTIEDVYKHIKMLLRK